MRLALPELAGIIERMLSVDVLGPFVLRRGPAPLRLPARKMQALLAVLAARGAQPRARIVAWLWPGLDEGSARRNLRRELVRLRDAGAADALLADGDALQLAGGVGCDIARFEEALSDGDVESALAEWRGLPLDGLTSDETPELNDCLEAEAQRLRGLRRHALERSAQNHEAAGRPDAALARVGTLLADEPLQECYHRDAMRLHAAAGRRASALAQYERCRSLLADELGLQPMAETRALFESLVGHVGAASTTSSAGVASPPAAAATAGPPASVHSHVAGKGGVGVAGAANEDPLNGAGHPSAVLACSARAGAGSDPTTPVELPDLLPYVGREDEVARLEAAWVRGQAIVIEGEGGIGKTRLAVDFAAAHGPYAVFGCRPGDAALPYAAFARALRVLAGGAAPAAELPPWVRRELARLVPEWGDAPPPVASAEEHGRLVEACVQAWLALAVPSFDAVIVDDWHLADSESRALFMRMAERRAESAPHAARDIWLLRPDIDEATRRTLRAWCDDAGARHLVLAPLPRDAVYVLLQSLARAADPKRFAERLHRATDGNPFFIVETLRHLAAAGTLRRAADGAWTTPFDARTETYDELPVPASVRDAVLARVARLGDAPRRLLETASLAAEPFQPALLAAACALSELEAVDAIDDAVAARLLREHDLGGYAFVHDLVQQAVEAALPAPRRRLVHRRLALGAEAAGAPPATVAAHHEAAGDVARAVALRLAAAEQARSLYALAEAAEHWRRALSHGALPGQARIAHEGLIEVARQRCEYEAMRSQAAALHALTAAAMPADERAAALIAVADVFAYDNRGNDALALLDRLLEDLGSNRAELRARALLVRSQALQTLGRLDESRAAALSALAIDALPAAMRLQLLDAMATAALSGGDCADVREHAGAALALADRCGNAAAAARATLRLGLAAMLDGDADAERLLTQAASRACDQGDVNLQRNALYNLCALYQAQCRHALALATARKGWELSPPLPRSDVRLMFMLAFVDSHLALGDVGAAWRQAQPAIAEAIEHSEPFFALAAANCTLELLGLIDELPLARRLLAATRTSAAAELTLPAAEAGIGAAQLELALGDAVAARAACAALPAVGELSDPRVRVRHALVAAELALVEGDAAAALAALPADDCAGNNDELRLRCLALRVRAEVQAGAVLEATARDARDRLAAPSPYAPATLQLRRAAATAGLLSRAELASALGALAESLRDHPAQRAALLRGR